MSHEVNLIQLLAYVHIIIIITVVNHDRANHAFVACPELSCCRKQDMDLRRRPGIKPEQCTSSLLKASLAHCGHVAQNLYKYDLYGIIITSST